jgi:hypothetical protein
MGAITDFSNHFSGSLTPPVPRGSWASGSSTPEDPGPLYSLLIPSMVSDTKMVGARMGRWVAKWMVNRWVSGWMD